MSDETMSAQPISTHEADTLLSPLRRFSRLALAVSGGPDSLALLSLVHRWRGPDAATVVLTVDHDLREGSRAEAETVAQAAKVLGLPHAILTWRHGPVAGRVQARARQARYDLMAAYCTAHGIPALLTAHHLDDCAETFLMRLKRGSGLDGLAAIPEEGSWAGLTLLRPLLDVPKARLVATVQAAGLPFVTDPSNADPRFERSHVRRDMQTLEGLGFTAEAMALSARRLRRARAGLDAAVNTFLGTHSARSAAGYASVDLEALQEAPEEIALRTLQKLIGAVGGSLEPLRLAKLEALQAALKTDPGKGHTFGRCQIVPQQGRLYVFREMRKEGLPVLDLQPGARTLWDNRFRIALSAEAGGPVTVRALGEEGLRALKVREGLSASMPSLAARALPACWRDEDLLGLPDFDQDAPKSDRSVLDASCLPHVSWSRHEGGIDCRATFLWGAS